MTTPVSRLRAGDLVPLATVGLRSRRTRTALSTLGIAIGIAAIVAVLGITRSSQSELLDRIDRLGTNLLTVAELGGNEEPLPPTARTSIARTDGVEHVTATAQLHDTGVYRNDRIPAGQSGGMEVRVTETTLLSTLDGHLAAGRFLTPATSGYPVVVLGHGAAETLGIAHLDPATRVWLGGRWFTVAGILQPVELAPEIDRSALIGTGIAASLGYTGHPTLLYLRAATEHVTKTAGLLARAVNPQFPQEVAVTRPSDALESRLLVADSTTSLLLGLGTVALLVGGIGIANVMVISVLERRTEIGLRRALGATRPHIATQFLLESLLLATLGGLTGTILGSAATYITAINHHWHPLIPPTGIAAGLGAAVLIGALAGLYPATRAARLAPTDALRSA
ncbi:ABC transporter permease [Planotetraspora kaengkrachanensis]|uniref:ABC transporter permease n=1 Tax=Planotetraspora kaengkrachanensis TaxID=575193 RepID=A0A8J3V8Z2_9ACTN|nr:FtsX-like permease family protein [Planotetraspora kaengkrachanensis]GIG83035.1 ABC transporter permease [Planotetraspora kaengkrachanensis]